MEFILTYVSSYSSSSSDTVNTKNFKHHMRSIIEKEKKLSGKVAALEEAITKKEGIAREALSKYE